MGKVSKFEQSISDVFLEACVASHNDAINAGQFDRSNKFFVAANAIESAWPDVIQRLKDRLAGSSPPPAPPDPQPGVC